jgi:copper chaperone CopZ
MSQNTPDMSLPLAQSNGCACCGGTSSAPDNAPSSKETAMNTQTFPVTGMTCGHCVSAVTSELKELPGVTEVDVELVAGGSSTVTVAATTPLTDEQVAAALDEAGDYHLARQ